MKNFIDLCRTRYTEDETAKISEAIELATTLHGNQKRDSGEPYITHPIEVASILFSMGMDSSCIIAGILHDVVEDCDESLDDIQKRFGESTAIMVDGVTKLSQASERTLSREEKNAENFRKMFLAISKDIRIVIIKLADRLHNMRTLEYCKPEKQVRKARETMSVYAPLAHRFGMGLIKCELEDLCLKYLDPEGYAEIKTAIEPLQMKRMELLDSVMTRIRDELEKADIVGVVQGRPKHLYSIYRKMKRQHTTVDEIYDLTAVRIIVDNVSLCYRVLGIVHNIWRSVPGRFKDYISTPKPNGYRSIHTTLFSEDKMPFEVQIRTMEMHRFAEYGLAAHWRYKQQNGTAMDNLDEKLSLSWFKQALDYDKEAQDAQEFVSDIQLDFFSEYVFAVTPDGMIVDLPMGSTPVDFAYRIHSDVGNRTIGAKVNGAVVGLDYKLKTDDVVQIITGNVDCPSKSWLDFCVTHQAKSKIKQWLKRADRAKDIDDGMKLLDMTLAHEGLKLSDFTEDEIQSVLDRYSMKSMDDMYVAIGRGALSVIHIAGMLTDKRGEDRKEKESPKEHEDKGEGSKTAHTGKNTNCVVVKGLPNATVRLSKCCNPLPGDVIFGYVTNGGKSVSVHREDCANARNLKKETDRIVHVEWSKMLGNQYSVFLEILATERQGLLLDVMNSLNSLHINVLFTNADSTAAEGFAKIRVAFEIQDADNLKSVIREIRGIESVLDVFRVNS